MSADLDRAMDLVIAVGGLGHDVRALRVDGEPIAKARARVTRHRHYTPQRTLDAEADIATAIHAGAGRRLDGNVAVAMIFYRSNRHRIDTDNLIKTVLDGITRSKAVWLDDSHVTALVGVTEYDPEWPRTAIALAPHASSMLRGSDAMTHTCAGCGVQYRPHSLTGISRYCSRKCRSTRAARQICESCGGPTSAPHVKRCYACYRGRS